MNTNATKNSIWLAINTFQYLGSPTGLVINFYFGARFWDMITCICFVFPSTYVEGLVFSWPWPCLLSLLDFLFLDHLGKAAAIVFVLFSYGPLFELPGMLFVWPFFIKIIETNQRCVFFKKIRRKGTLTLTPGMGMGMGGPFRTPILTTNLKKLFRTKIVHTSGALKKESKISSNYLQHIFLYTEKKKECEYTIRNNYL